MIMPQRQLRQQHNDVLPFSQLRIHILTEHFARIVWNFMLSWLWMKFFAIDKICNALLDAFVSKHIGSLFVIIIDTYFCYFVMNIFIEAIFRFLYNLRYVVNFAILVVTAIKNLKLSLCISIFHARDTRYLYRFFGMKCFINVSLDTLCKPIKHTQSGCRCDVLQKMNILMNKRCKVLAP